MMNQISYPMHTIGLPKNSLSLLGLEHVINAANTLYHEVIDCSYNSKLISVSGSKIFLGRTKDDDGAGGGPGPGEGQPYVKYQQLEDLLKAIIGDIKTFCNTLATHITPGYGAPSPQILSAQAALKAAMATRESEIASIKSERIFGE
jgi:hypothetical protein